MYQDFKITSGEVDANNVKSAPDRLQGTATENKDIFDKLVELFVNKYNQLMDELDDNTYSAIDPITINGYTISHALSGVTQGMYGTNQEQDPQHGEKFIVPYFITDDHGHIVSAGNSEVQLPSGGGGGGTTDYDDLTDKPQINSVTLSGNKTSADLSVADASHTHTKSEITDFPASMPPTSHTHTKSEITDFPTLATVATSGDYDDLSDAPQINSVTLSGNKTSSDLSLADASHTHTKSDITDFPTINDVYWATYGSSTNAQIEAAYQAGKLVCVFTSSKLYTLRYRYVATDHRFVCNYGATQYQIKCANNVWSTDDRTFAMASHTHTVSNITNFPSLATVATSGDYADLTNTPSLATVATSGDYTDLSNTPSLATVATSGDYDDLSNKPSIPTVTDTYSGTSSDGMSGKAVKSAIDALDGTVTGTAGAGKTLTSFSQTDGKVSATFGNISITKSQVSDFPTIPTVNDATLTIQKNGSTVSTFTANASSNVTANIAVPTKTSDLNNDSGFLTSYTETDPVFGASAASGITSTNISNWNGKSVVSVNRKTSSGTNIADITIDGTTTQLYAPTSGGTSDYDTLSNRPQINSTTLTGNKTLSDLGLTTEILNIFYPVGSYYETSDVNFDPNVSWSGTTWVLEAEGQVHVSGSDNGTYQITGAPTDTSDGGSANAIIPYHKHSMSFDTGDESAHTHGKGSYAGGSHTHGIDSNNGYFVYSDVSSAYNISPTTGGTTSRRIDAPSVSSLSDKSIFHHVNKTAGSTVTISGTSAAGSAHHHSVSGDTAYTGKNADGTTPDADNTSGANMPPYIIVNRWHRTA